MDQVGRVNLVHLDTRKRNESFFEIESNEPKQSTKCILRRPKRIEEHIAEFKANQYGAMTRYRTSS